MNGQACLKVGNLGVLDWKLDYHNSVTVQDFLELLAHKQVVGLRCA